jgi:hypothetical protein
VHAANDNAAHSTEVLRVTAEAAREAAFAHPRVPYPFANALVDAVRAANDSAAHGIKVSLCVAAGAAWEAAFVHPRVPDPLAIAVVDTVRSADASITHDSEV